MAKRVSRSVCERCFRRGAIQRRPRRERSTACAGGTLAPAPAPHFQNADLFVLPVWQAPGLVTQPCLYLHNLQSPTLPRPQLGRRAMDRAMGCLIGVVVGDAAGRHWKGAASGLSHLRWHSTTCACQVLVAGVVWQRGIVRGLARPRRLRSAMVCRVGSRAQAWSARTQE